MSAQSIAVGRRGRRQVVGGAGRRIGALARGETLLLWRSPMALLTALVLPALLTASTWFSNPSSTAAGATRSLDAGPVLVTTLAGFALLASVYYNLVTAVVARREELVLKRLRTGECGDREILIAAAAPHIAIAWVQIAVGAVAAAVGFGLRSPANLGLVLVGITLGTAVCVLLALLSTTLTRSVELAQVITTPILVVLLVASGLQIPLKDLPEPVHRTAELMPLTPVVELIRLGLSGTTPQGAIVGFWGSFGPAVAPVLVLAAWAVLAGWATARWFHWEPRR